MNAKSDTPCLLIIGAGYSGAAIAELALHEGFAADVMATRTTTDGLAALADRGIHGLVFDGNRVSSELESVLQRMTHLVICVAPSREEPLNDPVHRVLAPMLEHACPRWQWMAYLSTIGVYGDHQGDWVDESTPCTSTQTRSILRREAEKAWQSTAGRRNVPASVLRLSGIYGPDRNAVRDAIQGKGRRLVKPGQVFNRIHVHDIARATLLCAERRYQGVLNITDDEPAPSHVIVEYAHELVGREPPPKIDFVHAELSPMARSFYSENKRVSNALSRDALGLAYRYPTYREGLQAEALNCR